MEETATSDNAYKISLTLFDISKNVLHDNDGTKSILGVSARLLKSAFPARALLPKKDASTLEAKDFQNEVLRFLRAQDKWMALGSTLVKSQAFHIVHKTLANDRTVVVLPRTDHRKPYIPILGTDDSTGNLKEENAFPLSISHQFPFVGAALLNAGVPGSHLVGMDIVTFDAYNKNLYTSEDDFLEGFCGSFTKREWEYIQCNPSSPTNEFYIRWAMKEAFTKALGVGLGCEFNSFDVRIRSHDDGGEIHSVWETISGRRGGVYFSGSVDYVAETKPSELWGFYFLALCKQGVDSHASGCACVCMGPFLTSKSAPCFRIELKWTDIDSLVRWHRHH